MVLPSCDIVKLDAGDRFELPMHRAYETGVVTSLPAINFGVPPRTRTLTDGFGDRDAAITLEIHNCYINPPC